MCSGLSLFKSLSCATANAASVVAASYGRDRMFSLSDFFFHWAVQNRPLTENEEQAL